LCRDFIGFLLSRSALGFDNPLANDVLDTISSWRSEGEKMTNTLLLYGLIALIIAVAVFLFPVTTGLMGILEARKSPEQGVVKHDWRPTGRIDFTT
jgi:hypothetical protein